MSDLGVPKQSGGNRSALSREVIVAGVGVDQRELVESEVLQLRGRLDAAQRVAAADARERQRIGQDLHDGAQQRLTALRIRLAIAAREFESREETDASLRFSDFVEEVDQAIDELRDFVQGVYPVLLTSRGLSTALAAASRREARPIAVFANGIERSRPRSRRPSTSAVLPLGQCRQACRALGDDRPRLGSRRAVLLDPRHGPRL